MVRQARLLLRLISRKSVPLLWIYRAGWQNGGRMSNWAVRDKEVLIKNWVPPEAITVIR
jgi:hypothetical protein